MLPRAFFVLYLLLYANAEQQPARNNLSGLFLVYHTYLVPVGGWVVMVLGLQGCWYPAPADDDDDDDGDDDVCEYDDEISSRDGLS